MYRGVRILIFTFNYFVASLQLEHVVALLGTTMICTSVFMIV